MKCPSCEAETTFRPSSREHGKPGRSFVICKKCGKESQAVIKNGEVVSVWGYKGGTHVVTLRLNDQEMKMRKELKKDGRTDRQIYIAGMNWQ